MNKDIADKTQVKATYVHSNTSSHECGYCKGKKPGGSKTWGLVSKKTRVDDYENMMNKGWRRCGNYYYKTDLKGSCCQLYTIRLKAAEFKISHKQRKVLNKFNRFLNGELEHKLTGKKSGEQKMELGGDKKTSILEKYEKMLEEIVNKGVLEVIMKDQERLKIAKELLFAEIKGKIQAKKPKNMTHGDIATNAALVLFNTNKKKTKGEASLKDMQNAIVEKIEKPCMEAKFKVVPAVNGFINFVATFNLKEGLMEEVDKAQLVLDSKSKEPKTKKKKGDVSMKKFEPEPKLPKEEAKVVPVKQQYSVYFKELVPNPNPNPLHKYTVEIVPAIATPESLEIFKAYQEHIHNEPGKTMDDYKHFLCDSPLYDPRNPEDVKRLIPLNDSYRKIENQGVWPKFLGSYHMYHRIDGKLVAVGVLDYTPNVISSVYFFYDPKYKFLNWGVIGALREIEYVQRIHENYCPNFEYYYMGYYIQDCIKSVYKGDYVPSYLLCPETYTWVPIEKAREKIEKSGYAKLAEPGVDIIDDMKFSEADIKNITSSTIIITEDDIIPFFGVIQRLKVILEEIIKKLGKSILPHLAWTD